MTYLPRSEFDRIRKLAKERKAKRLVKRRQMAKTKPIKSIIKRGPLIAKTVRLLGLRDRKVNGPFCRIHGEPCFGTLAYHLVPQQRGDATRLLHENVVWACLGANWGEKTNRSLYRQKHVDIFGAELIERLEEIAGGEPVHLTMADIHKIHDDTRAILESF